MLFYLLLAFGHCVCAHLQMPYVTVDSTCVHVQVHNVNGVVMPCDSSQCHVGLQHLCFSRLECSRGMHIQL